MATITEIRSNYPQYKDMSDADLGAALHKKYYADMPFDEFAAKVGLNQNTSFIDKLSANKQAREKQMQVIADQYVAGDIGEAEALGRMGVKYAQQLPDASFSAMQQGFEMLPESWQSNIKEGAKDVVSGIASLPVPFSESTVGDLASAAAKEYQNFEQQHPVAAGRVSSVLDVGNLALPFVKVGGKNAITATEEAIKQGVKAPIKVAGKVASASLPAIDEGLAETAKLAQRFKIPLSLDQISSSNAVKNVQKVSQQLPFSGQSGFRAKQAARWQNEIFKTIGLNESKFTPKTMNKAFKQVGGEFDNLTKGKKFSIGGSFVDDLSNLATDMPSTYGEEAARTFQREAMKVMENFKGDVVDGNIIARQRARINALARKAQGPNKLALQDLETAIVDGITSKDPALKQALSQAKQRYKNLIVIEPLAAKAKGGFINPTQLNNRVSQVYRRAHTIGESGDIGDLARIGNELMPVLGGSDTVDKLSTIGTFGAAGGVGLLEPVTTGAVLTGNRIMQSGINRNQGLVNKLIERGASEIEPQRITAGVRNLITDQSGLMGNVSIAPAIAGGAAAANAPEQPTRITINPSAKGTEGIPDVNLPENPYQQFITKQPDVQLPATIPDTQPQASLLNRIMMAESSGRPMAMNDKSTAAGLFQFTDGTWNNMVKKYGDAYGITKADKMNPQAQQTMASLLLQENGNLLTRSLGRQLDDGDYYVAHVLGAPDAARVLKAHDKGKSIAAASLVGKGVPSANRGIFYDGNRPRSVREVVAILKNKVKTA